MKRRFGPTFMALMASLLLPACTAVDVLNKFSSERGLQVSRDIAYGAAARQKLDIYTPENVAKAPVVMFFYGGGWTDGVKSDYRFVAASLAAQGFVVVVPDYRLYPDVRFPEFMRDGAEATLWIKENISAHGGDANRIVLMGHSAGAYIAAMLTLDPQWLGAVGLKPADAITAGIGIAGPYDFLPLRDPELKEIFGNPDTLARTQPINFVDGKAPPMLLVAGKADKRVNPGNTKRLAERIKAKGGRVATIFYPRIGHAEIIGAFAPALRFMAPVFEDVTRFIRAETKQ
jgi:acetyl esterase/lipase